VAPAAQCSDPATQGLAARFVAVRAQLPPTCRLLAVSKGHPAAAIRAAVAAGQYSFGESRLQEAVAKQDALADLGPLDWHFIGRLQANKVRGVLRRFGTIHSVDSEALARRLSRIAAEEAISPAVLFQVKFRPDPAKTGFEPEVLRACWGELSALPALRPVGLMTIAPMGLEAADRQALFQECAALAADLGLPERSMGMSGDWPEAVTAGSTWVRLGSGLFGDRPSQNLAIPDVGRYSG
jgi:pyridoxal phosphate enzyme (YggS family)